MRALAPLAILLLASPALAQTGTENVANQLQKILSNPKNSEALGHTLAVGTLLGCTQKQAGKDATQQFYQEMQAVGKSVSAYCRQGHATEARALVLSTLSQNQSSPVYQAALTCYESKAADINSLAGPKTAARIQQYYGWAKDLPGAERNINESDICR